MTSDGSKSPWISSLPPQSESSPSSDAQAFPPLGAKGPSKAQLRTRSRYAASSQFEPYPPRIDQLTRQELNRLESEWDQSGIELDESMTMESTNSTQIGYAQKSGMSSVTVYDQDGLRLSKGPDIYRRNMTAKWRKDSDKEVLKGKAKRMEEQFPLTGQTKDVSPRHSVLSLAFTDERLDTLLRECRRRQRVQAIEQRSHQGREVEEDANNPLKKELINAFSSIEGFLAAFSKESAGEGKSETDGTEGEEA